MDGAFGTEIEELFDIRGRIEELKQQVKDLEKDKDRLELSILDKLEASGIDSAKTDRGTVTRTVKLYPNVEDKESFVRSCFDNDNLSMMVVTCNQAGFKAYYEENGSYPDGIGAYEKATLNIRKGR